jgi:hypothetical protein
VLSQPLFKIHYEMATDETDLTTTTVHTEVSVKADSVEGAHCVHLLAEQTTTDVRTSPKEQQNHLSLSSVFKRCSPDRNTLRGRLLYMLLLVALIIILELIPINEYALVKQIKQDLQSLLGNSTLTSNEQ